MAMPFIKPNQVFHACLLIVFFTASVACSTIKFLPGFPGLLPFKLETGYVGVGDVEFFYYFIKSEGNPVEDPLLLWLTGGPGCSALSGLLFEIGPLQFNNVEYNGSLPTLALNSHSWTKVASIIFLDAPAGTGFTYSTTSQGLKSTDTKYADQAHRFLREWLLKHPMFVRSPLYVAGDSYSGLVVPKIVKAISDGISNQSPLLKQRLKQHTGSLSNLKGYLLGNPATDPRFDENSRIAFAHRMALISDKLYKAAKRNCRGEYLKEKASNKSVKCISNLEVISECISKVHNPHVLEPKCPPDFKHKVVERSRRNMLENHGMNSQMAAGFPQFGCRNYNAFLLGIWANDINVQTALHIRKGTLRQWRRCNDDLLYERDVQSVAQIHFHLNKRGYRALIYSGDHDMVIPYLGTLKWIEAVNFSIADDWRPWLVDGQVAGYLQGYANDFTFATIKGGGHTAPEYQPKECFAMFRRWISGQPL